MGREATNKRLGSQVLKMDNLEKAIIEQVDPEELITETNRMSEKRLFKEMSSFEQSVAETRATKKKASNIADIYSDTFKHHLSNSRGKRDRNYSTNFPTVGSK